MNSKNSLSITEARKRIFEIAEKVQKPKTVFFLTQNGKAKAVVLSADEFDLMEEKSGFTSDRELAKDILTADEDYMNGDHIALENVLEKFGYIRIKNKIKKKNVQGSAQKKGRKRPGATR